MSSLRSLTPNEYMYLAIIGMLGITIFIVYGSNNSISNVLEVGLRGAEIAEKGASLERERIENQTLAARENAIRDRAIQKEQVQFAIGQNDKIIESLTNNTNLLIEAIEAGNIRGNQTLQGLNMLLSEVNDTVTKIIEADANLTKAETERLVDDLQKIPVLIDDVAKIEETLTEGQSAVLENMTSQLDKLVTAPPVASQDRQIINFKGIQELLKAHNLTLLVHNGTATTTGAN